VSTAHKRQTFNKYIADLFQQCLPWTFFNNKTHNRKTSQS